MITNEVIILCPTELQSLILIFFLNTNIIFVVSKAMLGTVRCTMCWYLYNCVPALLLYNGRHVSLKFWES